ncbi:hypothetical protein EV143_10227 [Flavobacterium chryseum]|nr:hypothetical protein EV143_10227 [Flavobacterium sp. P3160]
MIFDFIENNLDRYKLWGSVAPVRIKYKYLSNLKVSMLIYRMI